jgi:ABC-type multidrug transport system fused ATPase/permease subunit
MGKPKLDLTAYRQVWSLLIRHPMLCVGLNVASLFVVLSEGLGLGLVLSLLDNTVASVGFFSSFPILNPLNDFADSLTLIHTVRLAAVVLVVTVFVRGIFLYMSEFLSIQLTANVERGIQAQIFAQLHQVDLKFIHGKRMGDILAILDHHTVQVGRLVLSVSGAITSLYTIVVYTILMMLISWQLTLVAIGLLFGVMSVIERRFSTRIKQAGADSRQSIKQLRFFSVESLSAMKQIRLFSQQEQSFARFEAALNAYHAQFYGAEKLIALRKPLFSLLNASALGLLLLASTFLLPEQSEAWLAQMVLFLVIAFRLMRPAAFLAQVQAQVTQKYPFLQSVLEFIDQDDKPYMQNGHLEFNTLVQGIRLDDVSFRYDVHETDVLENISFEIPKDKMTGVAGASGAGKSTLVNLIARLYDCESGRIVIDGVDLRDLDIASWRSHIAVVSQDTFIFNDTVWANLRLARESATQDEIFQAARLAQAHDFIMALPQGYDTLLGDRGLRLSGGQQQRIAIARAILVNSQLLIFDEATSDLDSRTERAIQTAVKEYSKGRTILVIAHRLSTIRHADNIVVLDKGRIVEQGTHEELMCRGGHYWQLVQVQNLETGPAPASSAIDEYAVTEAKGHGAQEARAQSVGMVRS